MVTVIFPNTPFGSPELRVISVQVSPPSVDLKNPLAGPPLESVQGVRYTSQIEANRMRGSFGSIARSIAPAREFRNRARFQVAPPSLDRNTPRSSFGPKG